MAAGAGVHGWFEEHVEASGEQPAVGNGAASRERTWRKMKVSAGFWVAQVAGVRVGECRWRQGDLRWKLRNQLSRRRERSGSEKGLRWIGCGVREKWAVTVRLLAQRECS